MFSFKSINSVVIILPALSSGYFNNSFITFLSFLSTFRKILVTTFDGISSIKSTVSSMNNSSSTFFNSVSVKSLISFSLISVSMYENVIPAFSFDNNLNIITACSLSSSSNIVDISALFISLSSSFSFVNCFFSINSFISSIFILPFPPLLQSHNMCCNLEIHQY